MHVTSLVRVLEVPRKNPDCVVLGFQCFRSPSLRHLSRPIHYSLIVCVCMCVCTCKCLFVYAYTAQCRSLYQTKHPKIDVCKKIISMIHFEYGWRADNYDQFRARNCCAQLGRQASRLKAIHSAFVEYCRLWRWLILHEPQECPKKHCTCCSCQHVESEACVFGDGVSSPLTVRGQSPTPNFPALNGRQT